MAQTTHLPIYKVAYDLLGLITDLVRNMPRDSKQTIGGKINQECVEIVVLIFRANFARDKAPHLDDLIEHLQATHSHHDRAAIANEIRRRDHSIKADLTKTYRRSISA